MGGLAWVLFFSVILFFYLDLTRFATLAYAAMEELGNSLAKVIRLPRRFLLACDPSLLCDWWPVQCHRALVA